VVLWSSSSSCLHASVLGSVHGLSENSLLEKHVVGDACSSEEVWQTVHNLNHSVYVVVAVLNNNLEWSKELSCQEVSLLLAAEVLERDLDGSWLIRAINRGNGVILKRNTTKQKLGAFKFEDSVNVGLDSFVVPGKNGHN
jgi:hypothetical protein